MFAGNAAVGDGLSELRGQTHFLAARDAGEQRRVIGADAAEGEPRALRGNHPVAQRKVALWMMFGVVRQHQMRGLVRGECLRLFNQAGEIIVAVDIAVDHQKRLIVEQRQGPRDAAGGFQRFAFARVGDAYAVLRAIAQRAFDLRRQVRDVDHQIRHARLLQF